MRTQLLQNAANGSSSPGRDCRCEGRPDFGPFARAICHPAGHVNEPKNREVLFGTVRRAAAFRFAARRCAIVIFLALGCLAVRAQNTNSLSRPDYQSFKIITDRNIFDPNRSPRSAGRTEPRKAAQVDSFGLVGTLSYEKGTFAFFDGTGSSYRKALKAGDTIAGYKIAEITADRVKLEADGKQVELSVGMQMKKQEDTEWQLAGNAESFAKSAPPAGAAGNAETSSGGGESDVLRKLMQKREEELK